MSGLSREDCISWMRLALDEAHNSPPKPTNYCVGAVLVDARTNALISTGYTLELPGNTHAEQCCLQKLADHRDMPVERVGELMPADAVLFTTMEPCVERLSGNLPCVDRIIATRINGCGGIAKVYTGVQEPETFVKGNSGRAKLEAEGISCVHISSLEDEILRVATAGHEKSGS